MKSHAGKGDQNILRITEQGWWCHEHRERHILQSKWFQLNIKAKSNCLASHLVAAHGNYDDDRNL